MNQHKIDILCLQETKSKKIPSLDRFIHFQKEGYVVKYIQGGLGIIIKGFLQEFCIEKRHNNRDIMFIKCMGINIFNCYGRNDQTNMKIFINDIKEITEKFNFEKTIILGDFNIEDNRIKNIITGSNYHLIKNETNSRTRNIDRIITNFKKFNYDNLINSTTQLHSDITDHKLISNKFLFNKDKDIITNYSIKKNNNDQMEKEYSQVVKKATLEISQDVIKIIESYKIEYDNIFIDINQIFSVEKIINEIKFMKEKAVLDFDKIYHYKNTSNKITEEYLSFINTIKMIYDRWLSNFDLPILNFIKKRYITFIHKKGDEGNISNYRPISINSSLARIFLKLINIELSYIWRFIDKKQFGYRPKYGTIIPVIYFIKKFKKYTNKFKKDPKKKVFIVTIDIMKCFDAVPHILIRKCSKLFIKNKILLNFIFNFYLGSGHGIYQGDPLSPIIFAIVSHFLINEIRKFAEHTQIYSYVFNKEKTKECIFCGEIEDIDHFLWKCTKYKESRDKWLSKQKDNLQLNKIKKDQNSTLLLAKINNPEIYYNLVKFIKECLDIRGSVDKGGD
ncbi:hypothetical protein M0813_00349 [Anaeramoeba flamelloides]|uniref:Reverse transcriptase domain-containing protein n=1 Tax=Anaeramoeba flamelloides TaxID=1746091 RepID=A0ABQ8YA09_9EUKA|nr:hypothetical protein M0813_00349 [Anaeramoeba flamelloides]